MKVTNELYTVMKTYHMYNADSISAQTKLKEAEKQSRLVQQEDRQIPRSPDTTTSIRLDDKNIWRSSVRKIEKMKEKRQAKYTENNMKTVKAQNEYVLALEATNASVFTYFIHDVSDLIDCCDLGYHSSFHRALRTFLYADFNLQHSKHEGLETLENATSTSKQQWLVLCNHPTLYNAAGCHPIYHFVQVEDATDSESLNTDLESLKNLKMDSSDNELNTVLSDASSIELWNEEKPDISDHPVCDKSENKDGNVPVVVE
ncbi:SLIT-ROBO Rho GTPase-activating protein 2B-like [Pyxicephalus adspersus]|uniref:SLIT-ROBO Rho GTPase-activating protein 2B-like n=1 Tax=Pyxicephalus adspersus TaxID=30357 RepID=UPI003B5C48EA